jgi:hypothetical protein
MQEKKRTSLRHPSFTTIKKNEISIERIKKRELLVLFLTIISIIGALLSLLGYGVAAAAEDFNVGYETLFTSPFKLIQLSPWALSYIFKTTNAADILKIYFDLASQMFSGFAISAIILICVAILWKNDKLRKKFKIFTAKNILPRVTLKKQESTASITAKIIVFIGALSVFIPAIFIAAMFAILMSIALCISFPAIGLAAGKSHIVDDVLRPQRCSPLKGSSLRLKPPVIDLKKREAFATCIHVTDGRSIEKSGRLIFSTSSAVILFDPTSGKTMRVPTRNALIESVDKL